MATTQRQKESESKTKSCDEHIEDFDVGDFCLDLDDLSKLLKSYKVRHPDYKKLYFKFASCNGFPYVELRGVK